LESTDLLIIVASDTEIPLKENTDMAGHRTAQLSVTLYAQSERVTSFRMKIVTNWNQ
jgi:hypothetical protein